MRWLVLGTLLLGLLALGAGRPPHGRARATRGFKNVALSTARGFGKRAGPGPGPGEGLSSYQLIPRLKADWLSNAMSENPELARLFVRRFLDMDSDGYLTPSELMAHPSASLAVQERR